MIGQLPWRDTGVWLMGDTHVHHRQTGLKRVVEGAAQFGCDYLAFTEHSFYSEYFEAQPDLIEQAQVAHPEMVLVNGVEWSTPAGDETRAEQVGLLMPGGAGGMPFLQDFLHRFDTRVAGIPTSEETFLEALYHLSAEGRDDVRPTVILTHPHRPEAAFTARQIRSALKTGPALAALCGSSRPPQPGELDVWPWISQVGGVYDQVLADGDRLVMLAESHLHQHSGSTGGVEFWPGEYRRNYVYCPDRSEAGLFRGLRSGASYFVLGGIVEDVAFTARRSAVGETVIVGETLCPSPKETVQVATSFREHVPVESVELIGNLRGKVGVVASAAGTELTRSAGRTTWTVEVTMGSTSCYLRIRGSARITEPYPVTACFYTNPLWLTPQDAVQPS